MQYPHEARNNVTRPLLVSAFFMLAIVVGVVSFSNGSLLWFLSNTDDAQITRIIITDNGDKFLYRPGDEEFSNLSPIVTEAIGDLNNKALVGIGLSDVTLEEYGTRFTTMEVHFDRGLDFGASFRTGEPTRLLFPITGRHAAVGLFFRGNEDGWMYGALRMKDASPLYTTLEDMGYKAAVYNPSSTQAPAGGS